MKTVVRVVLRVLALLVAAFAGCTVFVLYEGGAFDYDPASPFAKDNICFERSLPGATTRFAEYTPVQCSDRTRQIAEPVGADYGFIRFEDRDADGVPEAIVESSAHRCTFGPAPCYDTYRFVLKVTPGQAPPVRLVQKTFLEELSTQVK